MAISSRQPRSGARVETGVHEEPFVLRPSDGCVLGASAFEPRGRAAGTLIVHGATAVPQRFYGSFAQFLAARGVRVVTYDYRGVGRSRPPSLRGYEATMTQWAHLDARAVHHYVAQRYGEPVAMLGHSFGGQLVGLIDEAGRTRGAIFVGAQLGYYGHFPGLDRLKLRLIMKTLIPAVSAAAGYLPGRLGLSEDLPRGVAEEWARWCSHPDYLVSGHPEAAARFARFDRPLLFYSFSDDALAPGRAVAALLARLPAARVDHRRLRPQDLGARAIGHFGFFRKQFRDTLWPDALDFLGDVFAGRSPRPADRARPACDVRADEVLTDLHVLRP